MWWDTYGLWIFAIVLIVAIVIWALLMMTIFEMVNARTHTALIVFACISLGPFPPQLIMAVLWIIFWAVYKQRLGAVA